MSKKPLPLVVRLPDLPSVPKLWRGVNVILNGLLQKGSSNAKLAKVPVSSGYGVWGLSLAPAKESGYQVCASSTQSCRRHCLYRQGVASVFDRVNVYRLARTIALHEHPDWFRARLIYELSQVEEAANAASLIPAVRLNVVSDVMWERSEVTYDLFGKFLSVRFYDYTKHYKRILRFLKGELPPNYHLTFSRSENNDDQARNVLENGGNVAYVFLNGKPSFFDGYEVLDGDESDLRFLDRRGTPGYIVDLSAKGTLKKERSSSFALKWDERQRVPLTILEAKSYAVC